MIDNAFVHACTHHTAHTVLILSLLVHTHSTNTCTCMHEYMNGTWCSNKCGIWIKMNYREKSICNLHGV